jgi:predicted NUDIX family NTP pyrophosphohydrolase
MEKYSAGLLLFRWRRETLEVLLAHPGGPFWAKKDAGAWSIPKGEHADSEDPLSAAKREFREETGFAIDGNFIPLGEVKQPSGKRVSVWALEHDLAPERIKSNTFEMEWPPRSGRTQEFPEVDSAAWFPLPLAEEKLLKGQVEFLARLVAHLGRSS